MSDERTQVVVVGAGLAGCASALFLARRGVGVLLVERHPGTSLHPRASGQFPRTMEMLRVGGVADEILARSFGLGSGMTIKIAESVRGTVHQTIVQGADDYDTSSLSPAPFGMATQDVAEPIMLDKAREYGADVRFSTELVSLEQDGDGVTARLLNRANERLSTVRADYLIAADGHRSPVRDKLGISRHGKGTLNNAVGVIFDADLSAFVDADSVSLYYLRNASFSGAFVNTSVPNRYVFGFDYHPERGESVTDYTNDRVTELIRIGVGDPSIQPDIKVVQAWEVGAAVADRFRDGRVFLAGDAAKVTPPTGGMGGNTAVGDGYDIAWKLADVLSGAAGPGLLDSYDAERRPFAEQVVNASLHNARHRLMPTLDLSDVPAPLGVFEIGFGMRCRSAAVLVADDDPAPAEDPAQPSGRPGFRAPHVPVRVGDAEVSTVDLFGNCWVLFATDAAWISAAERAGELFGVGLTSYLVGTDLVDPSGRVSDLYRIAGGGASLVRPDGVVAWQRADTGDDPASTLVDVLSAVLDRPDVTA